MKKIFTILAIAAVSTSAFAQNDLRVEFDNYTNNQVVLGSVGTDSLATDPLNTAFTITNDGTAAIPAGDTIVVGFQINGNFTDLNLNTGFVSIITDTIIPPGGFLELGGFGVLLGFLPTAPAGTQSTFCAYASLVNLDLFSSTDLTYNGDATPGNNIACVTYELNGTVIDLNVGLAEELKTITNKTFIANNQLIIENSSVNFNSPATINVISMTGQIVATKNMVIEKGRNTVDLNNLSTGIYVVSFQVEDKLSTTKVMVK